MEPESFLNTLDYIVIGLVLLSGLLALLRGFVREMFSLIAWIGAYFITTSLYTHAIPLAEDYVKSEKVAEWLAIAGVFVVSLIVLSVAGYFLSGLVKGKALLWVDRSLGFVYGLARGALVICLVYLGVVLIAWPELDTIRADVSQEEEHSAPPELLVKAKTRPAMAYGARELFALLPDDIIDRSFEDLDAQKTEMIKVIREETLAEDDLEKGPIDIDKLFQKDDD